MNPILTGRALSVVVCTRERPDDLARCLRALRGQTAEGIETVVVDNAPRTEGTARVAAEFGVRRVVEPRPGLNRARNLGLQSTTGAIVAYTDDDAVPASAWAARMLFVFGDPSVSAVTGPMLPLELETRAQRRFEQYLERMTRQRPRSEHRVYAPPFPAAAAGQAGAGANMAFRRSVLAAVGGFDEAFDAGMPTRSGGDAEIFARVLDAGGRIVHDPGVTVQHRHRRRDDELRAQLFGYGTGVFSFWTKRIAQGDRQALRYAAGTLWWHLAHRLPRAFLGRDDELPAHLVAAELLGSLWGPVCYWKARRLAGPPPALTS